MLFLNAGVFPEGVWGIFPETIDEDVQACVNTNALHTIYMAKALLGQLLARNHLSALVITSSGLGA